MHSNLDTFDIKRVTEFIKNNIATKINAVFLLASNHFQKCFSINAGVWLRMENKFPGNAFQLTVCWGIKSFPFLFYLLSFSGKQRERERERERAHRR